MPIDMKKARDYIYSNGVLWERALFAYLFDDGPLDHLHRCLLCYKNHDKGWGHALEHDIRCPDSNPAALEFLLGMIVQMGIPQGDLLDGTAQWLEQNQKPGGALQNPDTLLDYPLAPWWREWGGQFRPGSIVGNLTALGRSTPYLAERTRGWIQENLSLEAIRANEWLFMAYHAHHYFMQVEDFPDLEARRAATIENIIDCAEKAPEKQYYALFRFARTPDSPVAQAAPAVLIERFLDYLESAQQDDGRWLDEHDLAVWQPYATITILLTLWRFGRLS